MTKKKKFKARVRARMARTDESYVTARHNVEDLQESPQATFQRNRLKFREKCLPAWKFLTESVAGDQVTVSWTTIPGMTSILARIGKDAPLNHVFHPDGGGLDLTGARPSHEEGCIELDFDGSASVVRPESLRLVMPQRDPLREWAYFVLDTRSLAPSGVYSTPTKLEFEQVLELEPGRYVTSDAQETGVYGYDTDGAPLPIPPHARLVSRHFGGTFLIMAKASTYNTLDSYDGDHARLSASEFDRHIQDIVDELHSRDLYGKAL